MGEANTLEKHPPSPSDVTPFVGTFPPFPDVIRDESELEDWLTQRRPALVYFNCIWQGDANDMILRAMALASSPPSAWNLSRPEIFKVRAVATRLGELLGRPATFSGAEASTALLSNSSKLCAELGRPSTPLDTVLRWTAHWVKHGGRNFGKPTHFEVRDGKY